MPALCEARVPTYRRPDLLRRALESLRAQTHPHWRAVVLDDSPDREGEEIVRALADSRVVYRPNQTRLGAAANLDQAFGMEPGDGVEFVFLLEDDAALLPAFLAENIAVMERNLVNLIMRNQCIHESDGTAWRDTGETTRGQWLEEGIHTPLDLRALLFFMEGVSNGGLFWKAGSGVDLRVGETVADAGLQEYCRTLLVSGPVYFASTPLAVFTRLPAAQIQRSATSNRVFARGAQAIRRHLIAAHGRAVVTAAKDIARRTGMQTALAHALLDAGFCASADWGFPLLAGGKALSKGIAKMLLVANPVAEFLRDPRIGVGSSTARQP